MSGGTNKANRNSMSSHMKPGFEGMVTGGAYQPTGPLQPGGPASPQWGQGGHPQPNPAQMEAWKKQFGGWQQNQLTGLLGGGQQPHQFPGMNIPGLLDAGSGHPPGFPGYANLPKNWQDEGYSWQDPNNPDARYNIIA